MFWRPCKAKASGPRGPWCLGTPGILWTGPLRAQGLILSWSQVAWGLSGPRGHGARAAQGPGGYVGPGGSWGQGLSGTNGFHCKAAASHPPDPRLTPLIRLTRCCHQDSPLRAKENELSLIARLPTKIMALIIKLIGSSKCQQDI
eukprot:7484935-Pyramimonas_sp.AAC.1